MFVSDENTQETTILRRLDKKNCDDKDDILTDDQIENLLNNVLDQDLWFEAISNLNKYLHKNNIDDKFYQLIEDLLSNVNDILNDKGFQDQNHLNSIIDLFCHLVRNDYVVCDLLIRHQIHIIFFPFIQQQETLCLFDWLLYFDQRANLNKEAIPTKDHDQHQIIYDKISVSKGYHTVAHYCVDNDISTKLLEILDTPQIVYVLQIIRAFGEYFFAFNSFKPLFSHIFNVIYNDPQIEHRSYAIDSISTFAGSSQEALNYFLNMDEFVQLFTDYPDESPEILTAIMFCAKHVMSLSEYLDENKAIMFLNYASRFLNAHDSDLLNQAIDLISNGVKNQESYVSYCLDKGIVQQLFQIIGNGLLSFRTQTCIFIAICRLFMFSNLEEAVQIVDIGFFTLMSDYLQPMSEDEHVMSIALDALNNALQLSSNNPEIEEWQYLIYNNDEIIKSIEAYDNEDAKQYRDESIYYFAHSFLQRCPP